MAAPKPDAELTRLNKLLKDGLPSVVALTGQGGWFRDQALQRVLAAVPKSAELLTVDGQQVDIRGLSAGGSAEETDDDDGVQAAREERPRGCPDLEALGGASLFAKQTFVIIRRGDRWLRRYGAALQTFLPRIASGSTLVIEALKLDKRTKLAKEITKSGAVFDFRALYETPFGRPDRPIEGELVQWVTQHSRRMSVAITPEAALLLCAQVGKEPGDLDAELRVLGDQLGRDPKRRPLGPDELRGKLSVAFESTPFELAEAVLGGNRRRAVRSLRAMFDRGVKQRDGKVMDQGGLFPFATSWLFSSMAQVYEGRVLLDAGTSLRDVPGQVGVRGFTDRYQEQVRKNELEQLERGLLAILSCQREQRQSGEEDDVLLERFLDRWFDGAAIPSGQEFGW